MEMGRSFLSVEWSCGVSAPLLFCCRYGMVCRAKDMGWVEAGVEKL
jgi:hypothetical protein